MIVSVVFWLVLLLLLHSFVIYPMFGVLLGGVQSASADVEPQPISVLVPAHNEAAVIREKIENFLALEYPNDKIELVIADDGSTDETASIVRAFLADTQSDRIRFFSSPERFGKSATMNRLVDLARHDLLLFTDANVLLQGDAVQNLLNRIVDPAIGASTGHVALVDTHQGIRGGESLYYWLERRIQSAESRFGSVMGVDGGMYLIKRALYETLYEDTILDDFVVSMSVIRSGKRVTFDAAAFATECGVSTAREEFGRRIRISAGAVQLIRRGITPPFSRSFLWFQFVSHKLLRWISPVLLLLLFSSSLMLYEQHWFFAIVLLAQLIGWGVFVAAACFPVIRKVPVASVAFYFGLSQLAMSAGLIKGCLNAQSSRWKKLPRQTSQPKSLKISSVERQD